MEGWIVLGLILIVIAYFFGRIGFAFEEDKEQSEYAKTNVCFKYQGEEFFIDADNNYQFVTLWDTWWLCVDLDNANVENLKEAINLNNINTIVSTVYSIDEDNNQMGIHCKAIIVFTPSITNRGNYLKTILNDCFKAHDLLKERFIRLNFKQEKHEAKRVVIKGFN